MVLDRARRRAGLVVECGGCVKSDKRFRGNGEIDPKRGKAERCSVQQFFGLMVMQAKLTNGAQIVAFAAVFVGKRNVLA